MRRSTIAVLAAAMFVPAALANPSDAQVVRGSVLLSNPNPSTLQIVNTPGSIIDWQSFSIASGEATRFVQLNAASAVLNRVVSANPSSILGQLQSNGRVFLINPNGIVFGAGSVVDVAGLIASTRDITSANFLAGNLLFEGGGSGAITLQSGARILTSTQGPGGQVWLIAKSIEQQAGSSITAPQGQVVLAAGTRLSVGESTLGEMTFGVATDGTNTVDALGTIAAERGAVGLFADTIAHSGRIEARSAGGVRGQIAMDAARDIRIANAAVLDTDGEADSAGGTVYLRAGNRLEINQNASVSADGGPSGGAGGSVVLTANDIDLGPLAYMLHPVRATARAAGAAEGSVTIHQTGVATYSASVRTPFASNPRLIRDVSVTGLADGGYVVVWRNLAAQGWGDTIMAQRFAADGTPVGAPLQIAIGASSAPDFFQVYNPRVTPLASGGFVVTWVQYEFYWGSQSRVQQLFAQRFDLQGAPAGGRITVTPDLGASSWEAAAPTGRSDGGFVVTWKETLGTPSGEVERLLGQRYTAAGAPQGMFESAATPAIYPGSANLPAIATPNGGFLAQWRDPSGKLVQQRYDAAGSAVGAAAQLDASFTQGSGMPGSQATLEVRDNPGGGAQTLYLSRFGFQGGVLDSRAIDAAGSEGPGVRPPIPLSNGGMLLNWSDYDTLIARPHAADGAPQGDLLPDLASWQRPPALGALGGGGGVAASVTGAIPSSIEIQRYTATPAPLVPGNTAGSAVGKLSFATAPGVVPEGIDLGAGGGSTGGGGGGGGSGAAPVVTGNPGGGATFGGFGAGTSNAIYSPELQAAIALVGAQRAVELWNSGMSGAQALQAAEAARDAVLKLEQAAIAHGANPELEEAERKQVAKDFGEMERLLGQAGQAWAKLLQEQGQAAVANVKAQKQLLDQVTRDWLEHEQLLQDLGVYRTNPDEMSIVTMIENMSPKDREEFMKNVAAYVESTTPAAP